ncbi:hypothetical protein [Cedecea neteri]|uniref:hypothetical protein n=1 Tax=Cedecea neteri TaxID=158822 RepID=UPI0007742EB1|nr:hypothetical protein [Cedecea neteri]
MKTDKVWQAITPPDGYSVEPGSSPLRSDESVKKEVERTDCAYQRLVAPKSLDQIMNKITLEAIAQHERLLAELSVCETLPDEARYFYDGHWTVDGVNGVTEQFAEGWNACLNSIRAASNLCKGGV